MSESALQDDQSVVDNNSMHELSMEEEEMREDNLQQNDLEQNLPNVEERDLNEEESWTLVGRDKRRRIEKIDICISSLEKLPKQFALAKLFDSEKIIGIHCVKYINAFKVLVSFDSELNAEKLISCEKFKEKEWRIQKTWEVSSSYGIIRDIDMDLSESELLECIKSSNESEILSVKRLNRRSSETGWVQTETIRICFKGSSRPPFIKLCNLNVAVEPYVFPVTQCSRCWRFGHTVKICPSYKIICPKCGDHHANCETTTFKCVNCRGSHISLARSCPSYLKEKKIRALMSEFNCTYRRALTMYVPPFSPRPADHVPLVSNTSNIPVYSSSIMQPTPMSYAAIVAKKPNQVSTQEKNTPSDVVQKANKRKQRSSSEQIAYEVNDSSSTESRSFNEERSTLAEPLINTKRSRSRRGRRSRSRPPRRRTDSTDANVEMNNVDSEPVSDERPTQSNTDTFVDNKSFKSLFNKIYQILFSKRCNFLEKIKSVISISIQWCLPTLIENFADMSILKKMFDVLFESYNG